MRSGFVAPVLVAGLLALALPLASEAGGGVRGGGGHSGGGGHVSGGGHPAAGAHPSAAPRPYAGARSYPGAPAAAPRPYAGVRPYAGTPAGAARPYVGARSYPGAPAAAAHPGPGAPVHGHVYGGYHGGYYDHGGHYHGYYGGCYPGWYGGLYLSFPFWWGGYWGWPYPYYYGGYPYSYGAYPYYGYYPADGYDPYAVGGGDAGSGVVAVPDAAPGEDSGGSPPPAEAGPTAVDLQVSPRSALVFLNSVLIGSVDEFGAGSDFLYLDPGTYVLEFRAPGFLGRRVSVVVGGASRTTVSLDLRVNSQAPPGTAAAPSPGLPYGRKFDPSFGPATTIPAPSAPNGSGAAHGSAAPTTRTAQTAAGTRLSLR